MQQDIDSIVSDYQAASAAERLTMYDTAGAALYNPAEHQRRLPAYEQRQAAHLARFRERIQAHQDQAQQEIEAADRGLRALQLDPLDRLSGDELQAAAARKTFVMEDVERLSTPDLVAKITAIAETGDKVQAALYARYAQPLAVELAQTGNRQSAEQLRAALATLDTLLIDDKTKAQRKALEARRAAAEQVRAAARRASLFTDPSGREEIARRWGIAV